MNAVLGKTPTEIAGRRGIGDAACPHLPEEPHRVLWSAYTTNRACDMLPEVTCHCYAAIPVGFSRLRQALKQKSRINEDPAEFDWKCRLRLTSRGEHSRALMGGERAQEMLSLSAHHA